MKDLTTEDTESTEVKKNDGGPAFPQIGRMFPVSGMSLLDWFAGQALAGILARGFEDDTPHDRVGKIEDAAVFAYGYADAMLAERQRGGEK